MSRPEKPIDWDLVDEMLAAGCSGTEIAPEFNMHPDTFYRRMQEKYNVGFTDYAQSKKDNGDGRLRLRQYKKALKGDNTMLIFLGKTRLKQVEANVTMQVEAKTTEQVNAVMNQITQIQSDRKSTINDSEVRSPA